MDGGTDYVKIAIDCQHFLQIVKIREASATFLGGCLSVVINDAQNKLFFFGYFIPQISIYRLRRFCRKVLLMTPCGSLRLFRHIIGRDSGLSKHAAAGIGLSSTHPDSKDGDRLSDNRRTDGLGCLNRVSKEMGCKDEFPNGYCNVYIRMLSVERAKVERLKEGLRSVAILQYHRENIRVIY